jgi:hypothetical protein
MSDDMRDILYGIIRSLLKLIITYIICYTLHLEWGWNVECVTFYLLVSAGDASVISKRALSREIQDLKDEIRGLKGK